MPFYKTKADLISYDELRKLETVKCELTCSGCGKFLQTERDFAEHFIVPNPAYKNLGYCPNKKPARETIREVYGI